MASSDSALLTQFVDECRAAATADDAVVRIVAHLEQLVAQPDALMAAAGPLPDVLPPAGLDETLFEDETVTVMLVATPSGVVQPPHDHRMSAIIGVFEGSEVQRFFVKAGAGLKEMRGRSIETGEVLSLGRKTIHAISAAEPGPCRAVHVYLGPLLQIDRSIFDPETGAEEPFSMDRYAEFCRQEEQP